VYNFTGKFRFSIILWIFTATKSKIAIEVDGQSHEHSDIAVNDLKRQHEIENEGVRFLRFEENEVRKNLDGVVQVIEDWIELDRERDQKITP
jgi:very-short-patch-repair endonuclease